MVAASDSKIRVLCVDDVEDVTSALRMLIDTAPGREMECIGSMNAADGLTERVRSLEHPPDVVLLDANMPGRDPFRAMVELAAECPKTGTIIYSARKGKTFIDKVMSAGARGYICKEDPPALILQAIREVARGRMFFPALHATNTE